MIVHVVLFRPRAELGQDDREALAHAFAAAVRDIPAVRRARVGRRVTHGRGYEQLMHASYLVHPAHEQLAGRFFGAFEDALMYDYELHDGAEAAFDLR
jgi:hypothetical protein